MREGSMVRGDGRLMRVVAIFHEFARCVWIDGHGTIRTKWFNRYALAPLSVAIGARSLWPETGNLDVLELEREEQAAELVRKEEQRLARKGKRRGYRKVAA